MRDSDYCLRDSVLYFTRRSIGQRIMTDTKVCKKFTGTNFKRWAEKEFAAELRRKKIARVLLASNDPKISHPLPPLLRAEDLGFFFLVF